MGGFSSLRFGIFEMDLRTGELRKHGIRLKLQDQPFQVLRTLAERPGELVTREEIQQRIWTHTTFVDFDQSLNRAVNKVREALGETAENPRFIETMARRGYRFIAPVEGVPHPAAADFGSGSPHSPALNAAGTHSAWKWQEPVLAAILIAALAAAVFATRRAEPVLRPSMRLNITLPPDAPLAPAGKISPAHDRPALALSQDGARLAYVAQVGDKTRIQIRNMTTGAVLPLAGTEGAHTPFFSPDGASLGFFADGKLKRMPSGGGAAMVLADVPNPWGAVWGADGAIYFNRSDGEGIFRIGADGGPVQVAMPGACSMPELLNFKQRMLVTCGSRAIYGNDPRAPRFVIAGFGARYVPTGHILYAVHGMLMAAPFDPSRLEVTGPAVSLFEDLRTAHYGVAQFTVAQDGTLIYAPGRTQLATHFVWVDRKGRSKPLGLPGNNYSAFDLSPDGKLLALTIVGETREGGSDIWIYQLSSGALSRLTPRVPAGRPAFNEWPRWAPDGHHLLYSRRQDSRAQLIWATPDGSADAVELWSNKATGPEWLCPMSFSPDGMTAVVFGPSAKTSFDIGMISLERNNRSGERELALLLDDSFGDSFGQVSPDGHWMVYMSDQSGRAEVYVTSYPTPGAVHQITRNGGRQPMWNPAAPEIFYFVGMQMWAVDVNLHGEFRVGEPRLLFEGPYPDVPGSSYDVTADGQQFLMLENSDFLKPSAELAVVTNFFDELRRRVPSAKVRR